jgi:hypothetical protein
MLPVDRLRHALGRAAAPRISRIVPDRLPTVGNSDPPLLRIRGANLLRDRLPQVRIAGEVVELVDATPEELLVRPAATQLSGTLEVEPEPGLVLTAELAFLAPTEGEP